MEKITIKELRDQMAMAALTGLINRPGNYNSIEDNALVAYEYADTMLLARKKKEV